MALARAASICVLFALLGLGPLALVPHLAQAAARPTAPRPPGGNFADPVVREVDIDQPAVVRVVTEELATLSVQLCTRAVTLPRSGGTYDIGATGTGAFITSTGEVLTADHVVELPDDEIVIFAAQDVADLLNNASAFDPGCQLQGGPVSASDIASGNVNVKFTAHVSNKRTGVWLSTGYTGPLKVTSLKEDPPKDARLITNSSYTQDDLAIIQVNMTDTPSIALDPSANVAVDDPLTVIGFPGNGDINENASNLLTASVNGVVVSAFKTNDNGSPLIQVGGNVEHGDSGAPVLDGGGHVVGIVSFAGPDPRGITTFLRASDTALALIRGHSIDMVPGRFQRQWSQAFHDYAATYDGHWHTAARELSVLAASYPEFKAISPYLTFAQSAAATEQTNSTAVAWDSPTVLAAAGALALAVVLALLSIAIWLFARRRRARSKPAPVLAAAPYGGYPGAYGGPPAPGMSAPYPQGPPSAYPPSPYQPNPFGMPPMQPPGYYSGGSSPARPPALPDAQGSYFPGQMPQGRAPDPSDAYNGSSGTDAPSDAGICLNGHTLAPGQRMCPWCGAPRAMARPDANVPPLRYPS